MGDCAVPHRRTMPARHRLGVEVWVLLSKKELVRENEAGSFYRKRALSYHKTSGVLTIAVTSTGGTTHLVSGSSSSSSKKNARAAAAIT